MLTHSYNHKQGTLSEIVRGESREGYSQGDPWVLEVPPLLEALAGPVKRKAGRETVREHLPGAMDCNRLKSEVQSYWFS